MIPSLLQCQIADTSNHRSFNLGIVIGPTYEISRIKNSHADFTGMKMSLITRKDEIGISLQKLRSEILYQFYKFDILSGDIYYNKYFSIFNDLFFSLGLSLGSTLTKLKYVNASNIIRSSVSYLFLKLQVGLDYNIWRKFYINITSGYRIAEGLKMDYIYPEAIKFTNNDFSDYFANLSIKYIFVLR
jgi:hypothetical protein